MLNRRFVIGATLAGSMLFAATAFAQGQAIVGISTVTTYSADARITAVDPANRTVSLAFTNGATAVRQVSPRSPTSRRPRSATWSRLPSRTGSPSCCPARIPRRRAIVTRA